MDYLNDPLFLLFLLFSSLLISLVSFYVSKRYKKKQRQRYLENLTNFDELDGFFNILEFVGKLGEYFIYKVDKDPKSFDGESIIEIKHKEKLNLKRKNPLQT